MNAAQLAALELTVQALHKVEADAGGLHIEGPVWLLNADDERVARIQWEAATESEPPSYHVVAVAR